MNRKFDGDIGSAPEGGQEEKKTPVATLITHLELIPHPEIEHKAKKTQ